jgi:sugar phosphate isomerase/epimerase
MGSMVGGTFAVFVAASTECFPQLPLDTALRRLVDLEYSRVEIAIGTGDEPAQASSLHDRLEEAVIACRDAHRLTPVAFTVDIAAEGDEYYQQFADCCKLAKATKVVSITVRAAELGTPFNAEIERLRQLVRIATLEGVVVGLKTEVHRMTQDPDTAVVLCDNVKGLGITLDPSHYIYDSEVSGRFEHLMKFVCHVQLRDTNKEHFQVRVGQGDIEYGRLVAQLNRAKYQRALSVNIVDLGDLQVDHMAEMRKMRLLLETLL